jgi:anthranilate phosphoribosyltransferase
MGMSDISDAQIGAYLCATGGREITADELVGAARSMRKHVTQVDVGKYLFGVELLDTCGTGGTGLDTFNTSTASAFVVAASGQPVAKHGNRGATSRCGSADVLRELGIALEISSEKVAECVAEVGFGFMSFFGFVWPVFYYTG